MITELQKIAPLVYRQFPAFYREEGDKFIQFIKAYYEWLDDEATKGPIYKVRNLQETNDIDEAAEAYLDHFFTKYMRGIPRSILSDKRLLQKHILDVHRAKGSIEGLKLLFKLLYNVEVQVYLPQDNMLIPSSGKWVRNRYFEVLDKPFNSTYNNKIVTGTTSGATAYVTNASKIYLGNQVVHVFYINDIKDGPSGSPFLVDEYIVYDGLNIKDATKIKGSAVSATVNNSTENHAKSDILSSNNATGEGIKFSVSTLKNPDLAKGYIEFKIKDGGYGYAVNSTISITTGANTKGSGASFKIGSLANTTNFTFNTNLVNPHLSTALNAGTYGPLLNESSLSSQLSSALSYQTMVVGEIDTLTAKTSGDHNYDGSISVSVYDTRVSGYQYQRSDGTIWGNNAIITGTLVTGNGVVDTVKLYNSGKGYNTQGEELVFVNDANTQLSTNLIISIGAVGSEEGDWVDTTGFLNSDQYLTDSYYYQNFSYEILIEKSLDKYISVLKQVMHPVGNEVFGRPVIIDSTVVKPTIIYDNVTTS